MSVATVEPPARRQKLGAKKETDAAYLEKMRAHFPDREAYYAAHIAKEPDPRKRRALTFLFGKIAEAEAEIRSGARGYTSEEVEEMLGLNDLDDDD
ncbi:hypothetical protein FACS1894108_09470 [Planctomycetales bacterium]|nr:hypothetical protein FACS1894108_09470 [Planctomycetales bacterium]